MEEILLRNYETFDEIPEGNILVNNNSNLMYLRIGRNAFITREFIDSIFIDSEKCVCLVSYYNVKTNEKVLTLEIQKNINNNVVEFSNKRKDIDIIPLIDILNINENDVTILSLEDIDYIIGFKGEQELGERFSII